MRSSSSVTAVGQLKVREKRKNNSSIDIKQINMDGSSFFI